MKAGTWTLISLNITKAMAIFLAVVTDGWQSIMFFILLIIICIMETLEVNRTEKSRRHKGAIAKVKGDAHQLENGKFVFAGEVISFGEPILTIAPYGLFNSKEECLEEVMKEIRPRLDAMLEANKDMEFIDYTKK